MTDKPKPPVAATRPHSFTRHGETIEDPWAWLRDPGYPTVTDKDVLAYLAEENVYYEAVMAPHKPLADALFKEMRAHLPVSPAVRCFTMHSFDQAPEALARIAARTVALFAEGKVKPPVHARLPLAEAGKAHEMLDARAALGKIVLTV